MPPKIDGDKYMSASRASKLIGVHYTTVYRWIQADKIPYIEIGGILFLHIDDIERIKNKRTAEVVDTPAAQGG
jgi:excisionase family DNA binding protein